MSSMTIVERRGELDRIADGIASARQGRGSAICLQGIPGIGKTALLRAALNEAAAAGMTAVSGTCWREAAIPYEPWLDILCQLQLLQTADEWPFPPGLTGFVRVERAVASAAQSRAIVIGLDDLHSGDEGTLLLTRYLAGRVHNAPLVVIAATRNSDPPGLLSEAVRPFDRINLRPLSMTGVRTICAQRGFLSLSDAAIDTLTAATAGVPLHVLVALASTAVDATQPNLTGDLASLIADRLRELPPAEAVTIAKAAAAGRICPAPLAAHIAGVTGADARQAIEAARRLGLAKDGITTDLEFRHDLVRQAAQLWLSPRERAEAESAASTWFDAHSRSEPRELIRAAQHAVTAAEIDSRYAQRAVELGRLAAKSLAAQGSPDDGARILERLLLINEVTSSIAPAVLLLDYAQAILETGRLGAAMRHYDRAVGAAILEQDPELVAEAAAGLGALWVNSIRDPASQAHVLLTQRRALEALPSGFTSVQLRLRARIAAEAMFWEAGQPEPLLAVIDDTLRLGDPSTVLEVLSVAHNPLLGPQHTDLRLRLSQEMLDRSQYLESGVLSLMTSCWRTVDLFLAGDPEAHKSLAHLRRAAEATQSLSILYIVHAMETMVLIGRGRFADAEAAAARAYELGRDAEDPDALSYWTGHIVTIGWFRGRDEELLAMMEQAATNADIDRVDFSFDAAAAALAARAGMHDLAAHLLGKITSAGLAELPKFSTWLTTIALVIEAAVHLGDEDTLAQAYGLLLPYERLPIMGSLAVISLGSCHQWLGRAALALGRLDAAQRHLRAATDADLRLGHLPAATVSRLLLAECLTRESPQADLSVEIHELLQSCRDTAQRLGMGGIVERTQQISRPRHAPLATVARTGSTWTIELGDEAATVRDLVGVAIIATLTANPGEWIPATALGHGAVQPASRHALIDDEARLALRNQMKQLAAAISRAREHGDLKAQRVAEDELDQLSEYVQAGTGLGGRTRHFTDAAELSRTSVQKAIQRAIQDVERTNAAIAAHLRTHIVTGANCCYLDHPSGVADVR